MVSVETGVPGGKPQDSRVSSSRTQKSPNWATLHLEKYRLWSLFRNKTSPQKNESHFDTLIFFPDQKRSPIDFCRNLIRPKMSIESFGNVADRSLWSELFVFGVFFCFFVHDTLVSHKKGNNTCFFLLWRMQLFGFEIRELFPRFHL